MLACCALSGSASALTFAQTFFVPLTDTDLQSSWQAIGGTGSTIGSSIKSVISIAVPKAGTLIYYDQWEDGYDADASAPAVASTLIWGDGNTSNGTAPGYPTDTIPAGRVIVLNNSVTLPRVATSFFYDGRDRISATNTVAVARVGWPIDPGPVVGTSAEAYDTRKFGTAFQMPVGTATGSYQQFEYVSLHIMAAQDGTVVQVDVNADGSVDQTQTLNMGQTMFVNGAVAVGATVTSSKPVEVHEVTGDIGSNFESRTFAVRPTAQWSSGYFAPVTTTISTAPHLVILYNPGTRAIDVSYEGLSTTGTITVPAKGNATFTMPLNSAVHFFTVSGEPFYAVGANDAGTASAGSNQAQDWGYALMPDTSLTTSIIAPFAPGADDTAAPVGTPDANGSPVWVTPTSTTTVYVNYSGDRAIGPNTAPDGSKYDVSYLVPKLGVQKIYNPTTFDMSKSVIFTTDSTGLAGAWGEDPATAGTALPYLDLGYAIIPFSAPIYSKFAALSTDLNANGVIDQGDTVLFTLFLNNDGVTSLVNPSFTDTVPAGTAYIPHSTVLNGVPVPDDVTGTPFPLDGVGITPPDLVPGASATVKFRVSISSGTKKVTNVALANSTSVSAPMQASVTFPISPMIVTGKVYNDANGLTDGIVNGTATNAGASLYASIVGDGVVQQVYLVDPDGTFRFINIPGNSNYSVVLSTTIGVVGGAPPTPSLPPGYVNTGENLGLGVANDGTVDGSLSFAVGTTDVTNANFGIERAPTANAANASSQLNPGGAVTVTVPTLSGTDPEDASITTFIINTLPSVGNLYYNGVAVIAGQIISGYSATLLKFDPNDGAFSATFTYSAVDAAGKSSAPATVTMPFTTVGVSGTVYDDANGTTNNTVDGTGSNAGGTLYINLVTGGNVAQVQAVAADGAFNFLTVPAATYTLVLSTTPGTVGGAAPAASLPAGHVTTAEKLGTGTGSDGTADGALAVTVGTSSITSARFGFDRLPTAVNVTAASQTNPASNTKIVVPAIGGTDPEDATITTIVLNTLATGGTLYYNGNNATTAGQVITSFNPALLAVDPTGNTATTVVVSFTYSVRDAAGKLSPAATVTMPFTGSGISIFGNVFNDANGLSDNVVNGAGTNAGGLFAVLANGAVVSQSVAVASTGAFAFPAVSANIGYTITLSTTAGSVGGAPPAVSLPSGYVSTGEFLGTSAGSDGTVNGSLAVAVTTANISNANFGIDRTPAATALSATMANPGGTTQVTVPSLVGNDPEDGSLARFVINTLPANGTLHYNGTAVTAGQTITGFNPSLLKLDPNDGAIVVTFTYSTVDAAGVISPAVSCAITFTSIGISGTVFNDANGLGDSIVNGTGTNAGGTLYSNLISNGIVAQVATVAANGTYSFGTVATNSTYTVILSTTQGAIGTAAPSAALPAAYVNTGEFIGTAAGNDGSADGSLIVTTTTSPIINANFGIEATPTATPISAASQVNPAGVNQVTVPTLSGTDPEDASITRFAILSLPTNGTLYYNNAAVTVNQTITGYTASLLKFDPIDGALTASFNYASVDAAGKSSSAVAVTMPFTTIGITGIVFNDTNGLTDGIVNGSGTNAGSTLYASLVSGGNVVQVQDVQLAGTYNFLTVVGNTTYTVVISTNPGVVGSAAPAAALPAGYVYTGEFIGITAGNDGTADGSLTMTVTSSSVTNANFGIEQPPFSTDVAAASQLNPAGTAQATVPTLAGTDPEDVSVTSFKINTLPTNGTLYYNGSAVTVGQTITSYNSSLLKLDPNDGALTAIFTYSSVDAAGRTSASSTVTMPFIAIGLSGNVYNDANGLLGMPVNTVDGSLYAGAALYANLVSGTTVAQVTTVASGVYDFGTVAANTSYTVVLSTTQGTVGGAAPVAALPSGYVNTGENLGTGTGSDASPNGALAIAVVTSAVSNANFGVERTPTANNATASSQLNPAGTTQVTVPTLTATDPEDASITSFTITTLPGNGALYYNGTAVTLGQTINSYNATLLKLDPNDGAVTATFTYSAVDAAGKSSAPATVTMPFTTISITGTIFNDANGLIDSIVNGTGTNTGGTLYANLVSAGNVAQVQTVPASGVYSFLSVVGSTTYTVVLSTTQGTVGSAAPATALPAGYVNTGEFIGTTAGNDGTANGSLVVVVTTATIANANFGIERPPTAGNVASASQLNPAGAVQVTVPTLTGADAEDPSITSFIINTLPGNGILYYNGSLVTIGQTITSYNSALLKLDPNDGAFTAIFTYSAVDAAGRSSATATATMPFTAIGLSGNVYNDANGLLGTPLNTVDGSTYSGATLYANLVTGTTVAQVSTVTAGSYSFGTVAANTGYTVVLSTTQGAVGSTAPAAALPSGYANTGENIGTGTGSDGSPNGSLAVAVVTSPITNANFGVERTPTATNVSSSSQLNPAGTVQVTVPTLTGTDPEDASITSFTINTLPVDGTLYYNGSLATIGQTITSYNSALLKLDPNDGAVTATFTYSSVDAAGKSSAAAAVTIPFTAVGISGNVYNDANGLLGTPVNTVDGSAYAGAALYANLVSGTTVAQVTTAAAGAYNFGTVAANTSYTVVISMTQGTVGSAAPAAALPSGYVNTGENIGTGTGSDGSPNGSLAVVVVTSPISNVNFGVERTPTANNVSASSQLNPAGTNQVTVPTLTGTDPEDAAITTFVINTLPGNGTLYYNGGLVTVGQTITSYNSTLLKLDPNDGAITASFTYSVVDAAGKSSATATATMPFTAIGISGNVFNDVNGLLGTPANTVDGSAYSGPTLYANLVSSTTVSQVATVAAGAYSFGTVTANTSYTVVLSTTQGTVGNPAPAAVLPSSYFNTGENIGTGAGSDGSPNGALSIAVITTSISNANFGVRAQGDVTGHLYIDTNGNGTQNAGEPDLANVDVLITDAFGATQTVATNSSGNWTANVPPGSTTANVQESDPQYPTGYAQTEGSDPTVFTAVAGASTNGGTDGYYLSATIAGHLYIDTNGNGTQDSGEPNLAGVDVLITNSIGGTQTVVTNSSGNWTASVPPGNTTTNVQENDPQYPTGYTQTEGNDPTTFTAVAGTSTNSGTDGYYLSSTITGHLYIDTNGNGAHDSGEPNLAGVDVLITNSIGATQTVTTNASGNWTASVPPGNTTANVQESDPQYPTDYTQTEGNDPTTFTAVAGTSTNGGTDGYYLPATVAGHLYIDANGNGAQDIGEPNLAGVDVLITDSIGGTQTVTTNSSGNWTANVPPGSTSANVQESDPQYPTGSTQTQGNDPTSFTAVAGTTTDGGTDGYFLPGSITGSVLADTHNDNNGDTPISGVTLTLVDASGNPVDGDPNTPGVQLVTTTSAADGSYSFGYLAPGTYGVLETQPSGYNSISDKDGGNLNEIRPVIVTAGSASSGNDFIEEQPGSLSGTVLADTDADGDGDVPMAGVVIHLFDSLGSPVLDGLGAPVSAITQADGSYSFGGLPPGSYSVHQDQPSNYDSVSDTDGANNNGIGDEHPILVSAGSNTGGNNFIEIELGVISGYVLLDTDNNGSGDAPLPGVVLNLLTSSGTPALDGLGAPIQVASGAGGFYSFTLVPVGSYRVSEIQPSGHGSVSDVDGANNNVIGDQTPILMTPGLVVSNRNFVDIEFGSIAGMVLKDTDNNGSGDAPLAGVTITLLDGSGNPVDGDAETPGVQSVTRITDASGNYFFECLFPGDYQISETQPAGYGSVSDADGGSLNVIGNSNPVSVAPGQAVTGRDFVEIELGSISGFVRVGSAPLAGVTLMLLDADGNPVDADPDAPGVQPVTTVTDSNGHYTFSGVMPGDYRVAQIQPSGYDSFGDVDGGDFNIIGDVTHISVLPGEENAANNFVEIVGTCPQTWADWKIQHPGENAGGNPDADHYDNLNEYAYAMPAENGGGSPWLGDTAWNIRPSQGTPGTLEAVFVRPKGAWQNVVYTLEHTASLASLLIWASIEIIPAMTTVVDNGDCTETVTINDLETLTGLPDGRGFVRIRADLDEDGDTTVDHTSYTEVEGWQETALAICCRTYANPFLREAAFTGTVGAVTGQDVSFALSGAGLDLSLLLAPGAGYYVEVTSGDNEGHRFDVVSASSGSLTLANDSNLFENAAPYNTRLGAPPSDLAGDTIVLRRHWNLGEVFPAVSFGATDDRNTADQVQLFTDGQWTFYWLYDDGITAPRWVKTGDNTYSDQAATVLPPGQGVFFNNRAAATSILSYGEVRENDFIRPLAAGSNLIAGGYPIDQSPAAANGRAMTVVRGFFGSRDIATADSIYIWKGDTTAGDSSYTTYFLNNQAPSSSLIKWVKIGDASLLSRDAETLLPGNRSSFLRSKNGLHGYTTPSPWNP
ncbi:MAG: SdrD B-like domain-containing protein [Verrucomicrobiota bacterium]